jgi:L-fuculose-phosphate aldolase
MMSSTLEQSIASIVDVCHRLYARGFVTATDGNVSVRLTNGNFLTTRSGLNKGLVTADDLIEVDRLGAPVRQSAVPYRPSTEFGMHLYIYSQRADVGAVVHAHPTHATGFAVAGQALSDCVFPEVIVGLGAVPLARYATPSTDEVARSLEPFVKQADAILLANHGVVSYGPDVMDAYFKMEKVEHAAHILFVARMLGGENVLSQENVEKLRGISQGSYGKDFSNKPRCEPGDRTASDPSIDFGDAEIRELVRGMIGRKE